MVASKVSEACAATIPFALYATTMQSTSACFPLFCMSVNVTPFGLMLYSTRTILCVASGGTTATVTYSAVDCGVPR